MTAAPARSFGRKPLTISSTTASSGSVIWTRSADATASAAVDATFAPNCSSARALLSVRFHTVTASPRRSMPSTIPLPNRPVPMNATFAMPILRLQSIAVRGSHNKKQAPSAPRSRRKVLSAFSAMFVVVFSCSGQVASAQTPTELRWAGDPEGGAPFVEADPSRPDQLVGFDVEIAALFARSLGRTPEFVNVDFRLIDQSVARGDADIGMSGIEDTPARRTTLAVTMPYYEFREVLSVRDADASRFRTLADLRGKRVATLGGTIAYEILLRAERDHGISAVSYDDDVHPYTDLVIGRVDAVLLDNVLAERRQRSMQGFTIQPQTVAVGHYVAVLAADKGPLRDTLNETLRGAMRDGTLQRIFEKWHVWNEDQPKLYARLLAGEPVEPVTGLDTS